MRRAAVAFAQRRIRRCPFVYTLVYTLEYSGRRWLHVGAGLDRTLAYTAVA